MPQEEFTDSPPTRHIVSQTESTLFVCMFSQVCHLWLAKTSCLAETVSANLGIDRVNLCGPKDLELRTLAALELPS